MYTDVHSREKEICRSIQQSHRHSSTNFYEVEGGIPVDPHFTMSSLPPVALRVVDGKVLISGEKLERLYCKLPVLKFLIDGHPLMAMPTDNQNHKDQGDALRNVQIDDDFGIEKSDLLNLFAFFSPAERLPESTHDWQRLQSVATILGGCDEIDAAYKHYAEGLSRYNPTSPLDDFQEKYEWRTVDQRETGRRVDVEKEGFVFTSTIVQPSTTVKCCLRRCKED